MIDTIFGIFWAMWSLYLAVMSIRKHGSERVGFFLGSCLASATSYVLFT